MKEYIKNSQKITNLEIIELIKDYNKYYTEDSESYIKRRDPDILSRIDFEEINDEFILKFKNMKFEKIFKTDISNFYLIFTNKIKKLNDFNIILKLIDVDALESDKTDYLRQLKNKFNLAIKDRELTENNISLIKILADLTSFICLNEKNIDFLKNYISKSNKINEKIKHKIYMELIKFCNKSKNEEMKKFIISIYYGALNSENLIELINFLENLTEEDSDNFIQNIDNKYVIIEKEFYSSGKNLNIELFNMIKQKLKIKDDNKFIKNNITTLEKIAKDIYNKEIKFESLKNFCKEENKEIVLEKLNTLALIPDSRITSDEIDDI